jgi:hypothetical protein
MLQTHSDGIFGWHPKSKKTRFNLLHLGVVDEGLNCRLERQALRV